MTNKNIDPLSEEKIDAINRKGEVQFIGSYREVIEAIKQNPELGVQVIHVWLASYPEGGDPTIIFQKRSDNGRLDKFVGGHVSTGMSFDEAALKEFGEEMSGLPVQLVPDLGKKALAGVDLTKTSALMPFAGMPWDISERHDRDGVVYNKPTRAVTYIGLYNGSLADIQHDFEVDGIQTMALSEALQAIIDDPGRFTPDVVKHLPQIADAFTSFA